MKLECKEYSKLKKIGFKYLKCFDEEKKKDILQDSFLQLIKSKVHKNKVNLFITILKGKLRDAIVEKQKNNFIKSYSSCRFNFINKSKIDLNFKIADLSEVIAKDEEEERNKKRIWDMVRLYLLGYKDAEIIKKLNISKSTFFRCKNKLKHYMNLVFNINLDKNYNQLTNRDKKIIKEKLEKLSISAVVNILPYTKSTIEKVLREKNIKKNRLPTLKKIVAREIKKSNYEIQEIAEKELNKKILFVSIKYLKCKIKKKLLKNSIKDLQKSLKD